MSTGADGGNDIEDTPEQRQLAAVAAEKWNFAQQELRRSRTLTWKAWASSPALAR